MNILLVDDHLMLTESLKMLLELDDEIDNVDIFNSPDSLPSNLSDKYDIVLLDLNFGERSDEKGIQVGIELLADDPDLKIIYITGNTGPAYEYQAKMLGAKGFFDKSLGVKELAKVVKKVKAGGEHFSERFTTGNKPILRRGEDIYDLLTEMEVKVLRGYWDGMSIGEIADEFYISKRTVSNHTTNIYNKLGVNNREQAMRVAKALGYFDPE